MGNPSMGHHRRHWLKVFGRLSPESLLYSFFYKGYLPTRPVALSMPSKYMVSVCLDLETMTAWETLPVGEKSKRVREALRTAKIVSQRAALITALRVQLKELKNEVYHLRWGGE